MYDLKPIYLKINLGTTGLTEREDFNKFRLIYKSGQMLKTKPDLFKGEEQPYYQVSVLRHEDKHKLEMRVLVANPERGEEYVLNLGPRDLKDLTESSPHLFEKAQEKALADLITENLSVTTKDGQKLIVCQQRIDFAPVWQDKILKSRQDS